jgi:predicted integral membrane protein DUF2269
MSVYSVVLFLHIVGAIGFFMPLGVWLFGLLALRRVGRVEQVRALCHAIFLADPLAVGGILLLAAAGLYMAFTTWGITTDWIAVAAVSFILMAPIGPLLVEPRLHAIEAAARKAPDGPVSPELARQIRDPFLGTALQTLIALLLGIVFLMTVKPAFPAALIVMLIALAGGIVSGVPLRFARSAGK